MQIWVRHHSAALLHVFPVVGRIIVRIIGIDAYKTHSHFTRARGDGFDSRLIADYVGAMIAGEHDDAPDICYKVGEGATLWPV